MPRKKTILWGSLCYRLDDLAAKVRRRLRDTAAAQPEDPAELRQALSHLLLLYDWVELRQTTNDSRVVPIALQDGPAADAERRALVQFLSQYPLVVAAALHHLTQAPPDYPSEIIKNYLLTRQFIQLRDGTLRPLISATDGEIAEAITKEYSRPGHACNASKIAVMRARQRLERRYGTAITQIVDFALKPMTLAPRLRRGHRSRRAAAISLVYSDKTPEGFGKGN